MKTFKSFLLILPLLLATSFALDPIKVQSKTSLVIVQINDNYNEAISTIAANNEMSLEFSCRKSHVIVIEYRHNFMDEADVKLAILKKLHQVAKSVEIIFIELTDEGVSDC